MRKLILMFSATVITLSATAQKIKESEVPLVIYEAFKKAHSNAKEVKWEKEAANYEVEFEVGETEQSIVYDASGTLLETEVEIKESELPTAVKAYISKNYSAAKIKESARVTDGKGTTTYEAEIKGMDLIFDSTGKFIKEIKESTEH